MCPSEARFCLLIGFDDHGGTKSTERSQTSAAGTDACNWSDGDSTGARRASLSDDFDRAGSATSEVAGAAEACGPTAQGCDTPQFSGSVNPRAVRLVVRRRLDDLYPLDDRHDARHRAFHVPQRPLGTSQQLQGGGRVQLRGKQGR